MSKQTECKHERFRCEASIARMSSVEGGPITGFGADVRVTCSDCDLPFRWMGLPAGMSFVRPMVSVDGLELRAPLEPAYVMGMPVKAGTA